MSGRARESRFCFLYDPQTPNLLLHPRNEDMPYQGSVFTWHFVRVLSILLAAVTVWVAWQTAREFFESDTLFPLAVASFVAFLPSFLSLGAVVNNDNLIILLASVSFLLVVRIFRRGHGWETVGSLGSCPGLGAPYQIERSGLVVVCRNDFAVDGLANASVEQSGTELPFVSALL